MLATTPKHPLHQRAQQNTKAHRPSTYQSAPPKKTSNQTSRQHLRRWWEFQDLYALLSASSPHDWFQSKYRIEHPDKHQNIQPLNTQYLSQSHMPSTLTPSASELNTSHQALPNYAHPKSRQGQIKRQREWIYLVHYLAIQGLNPIHIISGEDDGREPDFTLIFYENGLYYVGIELTTLPRLRDQMGEDGLIGKRWHWQSLQVMAHERSRHDNEPSYARFCSPVKTLYMPNDDFAKRKAKHGGDNRTLPITQKDINDVLNKKAHKASAYQTRRPLDELWLLVHTDKYQPDGILTAGAESLTHDSEFDQIHVTRYPSHRVIDVGKRF